LGLTAIAMLMGLGNGMGSGLIMTIGADLSPNASRATFPRRVASDRRRGNGVGPLAVAVMTSLTALGPAIVVMGGVAWLGAASMWWWIPRYGRPRQ
jgi:hypothetical protein